MNDPDFFRADLHCHTRYSDGSDSPEELIRLAVEKGLSGLSITDHDTFDAYGEADLLAKQYQISLLPGIEFSASLRTEPVHILGYAFSLKSESMRQLCERHKERRRNRNALILKKLDKLGIHIEEEELHLPFSKTIGRPHIALALMKKGVVSSIKEAFIRYLAEGRPAYDPGEPISIEETIQAIHEGHGKAILAHPHLIKRQSIVRAMFQMPFDGLEGYYARFPPEQEKKWLDLAQKKEWIVTGGSDYHGVNKPQNPLGSSWVGKETFNLLYSHYLNVASIT